MESPFIVLNTTKEKVEAVLRIFGKMSSAPVVDVGSPPVDVIRYSKEGHAVVYFHDVHNMDKTKGSFVESSPFYCIGYQWKLRFYPGGSDDSNRARRSRYEYCSVGIVSCSDSKVNVSVKLGIERYRYSSSSTEIYGIREQIFTFPAAPDNDAFVCDEAFSADDISGH
jgi:hypothetical protein